MNTDYGVFVLLGLLFAVLFPVWLVTFLNRKTTCMACGNPLDEPVWHCTHGTR